MRLLAFALCSVSAFALMVKVYGVAEMRPFVLLVCLPTMALLLLMAWAVHARFPLIASDLTIGAVAGLIGAVAYDVVRIPAELAGYRVYGTISVFGLWLLDAQKSSRFTEVAGWSFNYFNGICFGMMYALFMRGRHWLWGVLWAFGLESLAVVSPFGHIFSLRGNVPVLFIAFTAHIAYGAPLGRAVQYWRDTRTALEEMPRVVRMVIATTALAVLLHPLLSPSAASADLRARPGQFRVEGLTLNPGWLLIQRGQSVVIFNPQTTPVAVEMKNFGQKITVPPSGSATSPPLEPGIYQFFVATPGRTHSSFVVVEPVERSK